MADAKTEMVDIHAKIILNLLSESKEVPRKKKTIDGVRSDVKGDRSQ